MDRGDEACCDDACYVIITSTGGTTELSDSQPRRADIAL